MPSTTYPAWRSILLTSMIVCACTEDGDGGDEGAGSDDGSSTAARDGTGSSGATGATEDGGETSEDEGGTAEGSGSDGAPPEDPLACMEGDIPTESCWDQGPGECSDYGPPPACTDGVWACPDGYDFGGFGEGCEFPD